MVAITRSDCAVATPSRLCPISAPSQSKQPSRTKSRAPVFDLSQFEVSRVTDCYYRWKDVDSKTKTEKYISKLRCFQIVGEDWRQLTISVCNRQICVNRFFLSRNNRKNVYRFLFVEETSAAFHLGPSEACCDGELRSNNPKERTLLKPVKAAQK
ncbi:hypothetical protein Zmor_025871 [Zophobas morio]|uniref:Uncharacterized protein n=1 Tax=Zophobas morio TaxID=2755281 RepID=A0AA38HS83_9CUCU|nr:hypothetical protein Zmor_025871 [Zophobas morio]